jgi:hypothetical protein
MGAAESILPVIVGVVFILVPVLRWLNVVEVDGPRVIDFVLLGIGAMALSFPYRFFVHETYEIYISKDGEVVFRKMIHRTCVNANDIEAISLTTRDRWTGEEDGKPEEDADYFAVRIDHLHGHEIVKRFAKRTEFVASVRSFNPSLQVDERL